MQGSKKDGGRDHDGGRRSGNSKKQAQNHSSSSSSQNHQGHHGKMVADFRRRFWISLIITFPILALSPLIQSFLGIEGVLDFAGDSWVLFAFSTVVFFYGGKPFYSGLFEELRAKSPGMMTLIGLAISVAYFYSAAVTFGLSGKVFYWELATLIVVMLLGHWIEMRSIMGASMAVESLVKLMPSEAHRLKETGEIEDVPINQLAKSDRVLIKPGEKIPVDGTIIGGETSVNESMLTGESKPVHKGEGQKVVGGSINGEGSIRVRVEKTGEESYLSQVISMVRSAQQGKSRTQNLADKAAAWLTAVALTAGIATLTVWLTIMGRDFVFALERSVTVMVITCPHALGLAIPLVVAVSTSLSAKNGLLLRQRSAFEQARRIQAVIFDKTGTLTKGSFGVVDSVVLDEAWDERRILSHAAAVESNSEHPIAKGIVEHVKDYPSVSDFKAITGRGASGIVQGKEVKVVGPGYMKEKGISVDEKKIAGLMEGGKTVVFVIVEQQVVGAVALADMVRADSKEAIARLKDMGIRTMMVTGDNRDVAGSVAKQLGLDEYFAGILPEKKVEKIKEVQDRGIVTAMVGDGINDAPALAQAHIGIAIGAGTDVAAETADVIMVRSNPMDVVSVISLSKASYRKMLQNLAWATGYNVVAIPLAAGVLYDWGILLSPAAGAILMSASTVIVAINARFLKV